MRKRRKAAASGVVIALQIDGEVWRRVDSLEDSAPDDRHFVAVTDASGATTIRFGDGEHGARLPEGADRVVAAYRSSKRFVAVVEQQGRVVVDHDWNERDAVCGRYGGVYRGVVMDNVDPTARSRVRVQLPALAGVEPVWAMPCQPVGAATLPAIGAGVWVAFEGGDPARPVWIGIAQ